MPSNARKRPPMRKVTVQRIQQLPPRVRRITFGGEALIGFSTPRPGAHIKLLLGENLQLTELKKLRSQMRTYTPRSFNPKTNELTVEFVLHGHGLASTWATQAQVGDTVTVAGPAGGMDIPETLKTIVMLVDESAIPAAGTVLEALPPNCTPIVICEAEDIHEKRSLSASIDVEPIWLLRQDQPMSPGQLLENYLPHALASVKDCDAPFWWVACEASTMRRIRTQLLNHKDISKDQLVSRGYWKAGSSNHPDHDYGES